MLTINNIKINPQKDTEKEILKILQRQFSGQEIRHYEIVKKSIDARDKSNIKYIYTIAVELTNEKLFLKKGHTLFEKKDYSLSSLFEGQRKNFTTRPIIIGSGPAGIFVALCLALAGANPVIIERGQKVFEREKSVAEFNNNGTLDVESNIQFGEGGAGTFSDGKLTTGINSKYIKCVLNEYVECGAPKEIEYLAKPHIGTDKLRLVTSNMRQKIISLGGQFLFDSKVTDLIIESGQIKGIIVNGNIIKSDTIVLAIGHSARDTYEMLLSKNIIMEPKPFSLGVRIEHLQKNISHSQYGEMYDILPAAAYSAAVHLKTRSLYTFCMCPGGRVVNASSEKGHICVNGMSNYARDLENANSALLVNTEIKDYGSDSPLAGMYFQRKYESAAYKLSDSYYPPVQLLGDFLKGKITSGTESVTPSVTSRFCYADLNKCLPDFVAQTLNEGIPLIADKIKGFDKYDSVLTGIEARSSSPVRILRNSDFCTSIDGLYAIGEGAGYAGGITSCAVDGIKFALRICGIEG